MSQRGLKHRATQSTAAVVGPDLRAGRVPGANPDGPPGGRALPSNRRHGLSFVFCLLLALCVFCPAAFAAAPGAITPAMPGVSFDQRLGEKLPLDTVLRDDSGAAVRLGDSFGRLPVVLIFGYSRCPQLCSVVSTAAVETFRGVTKTVGEDYNVVYISIDPTDTPRDMAGLKRRDMRRYGRSQTGWYYLCGTEANVRRVANGAGFHYVYDDRRKLYDHASGFIVVTPDGRLSRYFFGVDYPAKDVAGALERAAQGKTGESVYQLLLVCARGLGITGRYGRLIWTVLEIAVSLTVVAVFGGIGWMFWQERRQKRAEPVEVES